MQTTFNGETAETVEKNWDSLRARRFILYLLPGSFEWSTFIRFSQQITEFTEKSADFGSVCSVSRWLVSKGPQHRGSEMDSDSPDNMP
jgi:hypothetical protein